jgi:hypothetical protein
MIVLFAMQNCHRNKSLTIVSTERTVYCLLSGAKTISITVFKRKNRSGQESFGMFMFERKKIRKKLGHCHRMNLICEAACRWWNDIHAKVDLLRSTWRCAHREEPVSNTASWKFSSLWSDEFYRFFPQKSEVLPYPMTKSGGLLN